MAVLVFGFCQTFLHALEQLRRNDLRTVCFFSGTLERPCVSLVGKDSGDGINAELLAAAGSIAGVVQIVADLSECHAAVIASEDPAYQ